MVELSPRGNRAVPVRYLVPNLLTTMSLCCGLAAIHFSIKAAFPGAFGSPPVTDRIPRFNDWDRALIAVALAAIFDALDGRAARLLRVSSRFGAVLDSLSDFLSFGVAPALILYLWSLHRVEGWGLAAVVTFSLCSALRLARFTSSIAPKGADSTRIGQVMKHFFVGCPTPAAAGAALVPLMLAQSRKLDWEIPDWVVVAATFFIAWLMISRRPMFSFKRIRVPRGLVVPLLVVVGLVVALIVIDTWAAIAMLCASYVLALPASMFTYHQMVKKSGVGGVSSWSAGLPMREQIRRAQSADVDAH